MDDDQRSYTDGAAFPEHVTLRPIGRVRSPFVQRHGTPRQPGLRSAREAGEVPGAIELFDTVQPALALRDLDRFTHVWVIAWMHLNGPRRRPLVRPPRGGPKRGVFATRAPHRPNNLSLSVCRLLGIDGAVVRVSGLDLLDGTPVLDLKPYIPDFDTRPEAGRGWLDDG